VTKLSKSTTLIQFENGYWYATELKKFAEEIGIPSANKLRKDELEKAISVFLRNGKIEKPTERSLSRTGIKDVDKGLSLRLRVINYTSNKETKAFIEREARKIAPNLKRKSGARYRLNRWREEQLTNGIAITYEDLVRRYIELNQSETGFAKIPHARYINFLSEFFANENEATKEQAIRAWKKLKKLDAPKTYTAWLKSQRERPLRAKGRR
jgi:SAP domain-containing new25